MILSTHIVDDVKELCTDMAIINKGEVLYKGSPMDAIAEIQGKVWSKRIAKSELEEYRKNFNVISERLIAGAPEIHVFHESSPDGFQPLPADLEDVYFTNIFKSAKEAAEVK